MYELEYVKKRKRRKLVAIVGGISVVVISALSIVSFLGRYVGTFTVSLDTGKVALTLSEKSNFATSTSYIRIDNVPTFSEFTYQDFTGSRSFENIDSEETDLKVGATSLNSDGSIDKLGFLKSTFYIKNVGSTPAKYDFDVKLLESKAADDGRSLDETVRVMIFSNKEANAHEKEVYAKRLSIPQHYVDGVANYDAPISVSEYQSSAEHPFQGYATQFKSETLIASLPESYFGAGEIRRYTIVTWLEGFASDNNLQAPKGASIKIGVEINAYEI